MVAVSDTSPISCLASLGQLKLLSSQFREVWIPPAVRTELGRYPHAEGLAAIEDAIASSRVTVHAPRNHALVQALETELHRGEAEAIVLAGECPEAALLIDEREGRLWALRLGLRPVGTIGILVRARADGQVESLKDALSLLRERYGFFIQEALYREVLMAAGETV
jgi:predicted nucleic acid-binding protein